MKTYILAVLVLVILVGLGAFMGHARADDDPWARVIENTNARLTCGSVWLDVVGEWWVVGVGATRLGTAFGPYELLVKFEGLCLEQGD